jgi:hypothetical protein
MTEATTTAEVDKTAVDHDDTKTAETTTQSTTAATTEAAKTADTTRPRPTRKRLARLKNRSQIGMGRQLARGNGRRRR